MDVDVNRTHCHMLIMNCACETDNLKKIMRETVKPSLMGNGNSFWSFKTKSKKHGEITPVSSLKYITYMSKGVYDPKYVKGYDDDFLSERKAAWEQPEEQQSAKEQAYDAFEANIMYPYCRDNPHDCVQGMYLLRYDKADVCMARARSYAFELHKRIWDVQTARLAKMFFLTYCMRHGILVDEQKHKIW